MTNKLDLSFLDQIQMILDNPQGLDVDMLREIAAEHSEAVVAVNDRLNKTCGLINQGLRSEALQQSEQSPRILDLIGKLDFPGQEVWSDILVNLDIQPPPRLKIQLAQDLANAYDDNLNIEGLLRKHRLLALAKAPLAQRIRVLRLIKRNDPLNPVWDQDIETWERVRLNQIPAEVKALVQRNNREGLAVLLKELDAPWVVGLAKEVKRQVQLASEKIEADWARQEMIVTAKDLNDALAALDVVKGNQLRDQWIELEKLARLPSDSPQREHVSEALDWLQAEDKLVADDQAYEQAVTRLEKLIDRHASAKDLGRGIYELQKFHRDDNPELVRRALRQQKNLEDSGRRRNTLFAAGTLLGLVAISIVVFMALQQRLRNRETSNAHQQLSELLKNQEFKAAENYFSTLPIYVKDHAEIVKIWTAVRAANDIENVRLENFRSAMEQAISAGLDSPRMDFIVEAKQRARLENEKEEIRILERKIETRQTDLQASRTQLFNQEFDRLTKELSTIENLHDNTDRENNLSQIREKFIELQAANTGGINGRPKISLTALEQVNPLIKRIDLILNRLAAIRKQQAAIEDVVDSIGSASSFELALQRACELTIEPTLKLEFELSLKEAAHWKALEAWQEISSRPSWNTLSKLDPRMALELLSSLQAAKQSSPNLWLNQAAAPAMEVLQKQANYPPTAVADAIARIKAAANLREYLRLYMVVDNDGAKVSWFYSDMPPNQTETHHKIEYFKNLQMLEKENKTFSKASNRVIYSGEATQSRLAKAILARLKEQNESFEQLGWDLLELILNDTSDEANLAVDPLIKAVLLEEVVIGLMSGSYGFELLLVDLREDLAKTFASRTDWMDPSSETTALRRNESERVLTEYKSQWSELRQSWQKRLSEIDALSLWRESANYELIGWIYRDSGDQFIAKVSQRFESQIEIFALFPSAGNANVVKMESIGKYNEGNLLEPNLGRLQSGRPIYRRK